MSNDAFKLAKLQSEETRFVTKMDILKYAIRYGVYLGIFICITIILRDALKASPTVLHEFTDLVKTMRVADYVFAVSAVLEGCVIAVKQKQLTRLRKKTGELRHEKEYNDPVNGRSGLNEKGISPTGK